MVTKQRKAGTKRAAKPPVATAEPKLPRGYKIPERIFAQASTRSVGGVSMLQAQAQIHARTVANFGAPPEVLRAGVRRLTEAGFEILQVSSLSINIAGSQEVFEKAFRTRIVPEERRVIKPVEGETTATFLDAPDAALPGLIETAGTAFADVIEGVAIEQPRYYMAPSMFAPPKAYWHLRVPGDVSLGTNADRAHRAGFTGRGVRVAMVDSGWYQHPYFVGRGYRAAPVVLAPGAANPLDDESGHGTGESANIFAVAPDVTLLPVKLNFVNTVAGFNAAVGLGPDIITCSWGSSIQFGPLSAADQALAAAIAAAVAAGIVVVFSAGNGHYGFPGQHPDVISAGGTFMRPDGTLRASDYASGFASNIYPGRRVPDLCGLVGMLPKAIYIMLPLQAGDQIDTELAGGTFPNGDETARDDGWAAFSGTSAAAPQLAGAAALVKQACSRLSPSQVRDVLITTARDVTEGNGSAATGGNPALPGPDLATGAGLVDAQKAALVARLRCLTPPGPISVRPGPIKVVQPVEPITPVEPIRPVEPIVPIQPITPIRPITPVEPIAPVQPIVPIEPVRPVVPVVPITPVEPVRPVVPIQPIEPIAVQTPTGGAAPASAPAPPLPPHGAAGAPGLTAEELQEIERLVIDSGLDVGD